jgi:Tfp pilus assembly protein PilN
MLNLNLVSKELKQETKLRHIYKMLKQADYILIIITIFIAIVMLVAKIILQNNFNKIVEETTLITRDSQGRNSQIREINNHISFVEKVQNDFIPWSFLFKDLDKYVNSDLSFYSIRIDRDKKTIELKGIAKNRDSLLALKSGLEKSDIFFGVIFPVKNILEKEDINFEIEADLNIDKIKESQ